MTIMSIDGSLPKITIGNQSYRTVFDNIFPIESSGLRDKLIQWIKENTTQAELSRVIGYTEGHIRNVITGEDNPSNVFCRKVLETAWKEDKKKQLKKQLEQTIDNIGGGL